MIDPVTFGALNRVAVQNGVPVRTGAGIKALIAASAPASAAAVSLPRLVSLAAELAALGPPVDTDKIAQIEQAIAMGHLRSDPRAIAAAMLGLEFELPKADWR